MMFKNNTSRLVLLCIVLAICSVFFLAAPYFGVAQLSLEGPSTDWAVSIHATQNSYHLWRLDPLTSLVASVLSSFTPMTERFQAAPIQLSILFIGIGALLTTRFKNLKTLPVLTWVSSFLITSTLAVMFGRDVVTFGALQWLPLFTLSLCALRFLAERPLHGAILPVVIGSHFFGLLLAEAANQFAMWIALLAYLLARVLTHRDEKNDLEPSHTDGTSGVSSLNWIVYLSPLAYSVYTVFTAPLPDFPQFPHDGLLVPDDGAPGVVRPNVGLDLPLATLNRECVRAITLAFTVPLLLLCGYLISRLTNGTRRCAVVLGAMIVVMIVDSLLPETVALTLPTHTLQRLLPGQTFLPWNTTAIGLCSLVLGGLLTTVAPLFGPLLLVLAVAASKAFVLAPSLSMVLAVPYATKSSEELVEVIYSPLASQEEKKFLLSPSAQLPLHFRYLFFPHGQFDYQAAKSIAALQPIRIKKILRSISSTPTTSAPLVSLLTDKNVQTRWSPGGGAQIPGQSLRLEFSEPQRFSGVSMETGEFITDYPRGVRVTIPTECLTPNSIGGSWEFPTWRGPLRFSEDGYPYFGHLGDVTIAFGVEVTARCVVIEQTGRDPYYDWSVTEIALLTTP